MLENMLVGEIEVTQIKERVFWSAVPRVECREGEVTPLACHSSLQVKLSQPEPPFQSQTSRAPASTSVFADCSTPHLPSLPHPVNGPSQRLDCTALSPPLIKSKHRLPEFTGIFHSAASST